VESAEIAYVALGSNLGDRDAHLAAALAALGATEGIEVRRVSPVYETDPVGPPPQDRYLNAVVELRCALAPRALLERLLEIESERGRRRGSGRNAARTLDLDLLLHGDRRLDEPGLVVPHPRLHQRGFVLEPLADLAPQLVHPVRGQTVAALARQVRDPGAVSRRPTTP
jgi:2-amino-4-hydroxy-6-hydroxymethyldihydropteridine diphosphokinase